MEKLSRAPPLLGKGCICPEPREADDGKPDLRSLYIHTTTPSPEEALSFLRSRAVTGSTGRKAVVLVMANWGNRNLVDNLLCSSHDASIAKYPLFASDPESFRLFRQHGSSGAFYNPSVFQADLPPQALEISTGAKDLGAWSALLRARVNAVRYALDAGLDVLFTDADVVFHRNVIPELQKVTEAKDALFMCGVALSPSSSEDNAHRCIEGSSEPLSIPFRCLSAGGMARRLAGTPAVSCMG